MTKLPIIQDRGTQQKIRIQLELIAHQLLDYKDSNMGNFGLMDGELGLALFWFYYARFLDDQAPYSLGFRIIENTIDRLESITADPFFCSGLAGLGWTIRHLIHKKFLKSGENVIDQINSYLARIMISLTRGGNFDFLHGALGCAHFFMTGPLTPEIKQSLELLPGILAETAFTDQASGGIKWLDRRSKGEEGPPTWNLGMAHGIPSIMVFLSRMYREGFCKKEITPLLDGSITYLLSQKLDDSHISIFPPGVTEGEPPKVSRLGWCYGDPGIGIALWQAGQARDNNEWQSQAIEIFRHCTTRKSLEETQIKDSSLCHGSAGIGQMFNRMYRNTGLKEFQEAARFWIEHTLKISPPAGGSRNPDLLNGLAGTGLALIAAISPEDPAWDNCMLLS